MPSQNNNLALLVKKSLVYLQIPLIATALAGCLATTDLATDPTTDFTTQGIAQKISQLTSDRCIRYTYDVSTGRKLSGDIKFYQRPVVRKILKSTDGWYMATVTADSKKYTFVDISSVSQKLLPNSTTRTQEKINYLERSIAISWGGYKDLWLVL